MLPGFGIYAERVNEGVKKPVYIVTIALYFSQYHLQDPIPHAEWYGRQRHIQRRRE